MKQAIKILLITYLVASNGEQQDERWNFKKESRIAEANNSRLPNQVFLRSEYTKLAQDWFKDRRKAGNFMYVEAKEGVNDKIVDAGLKPIQINTETKFVKGHRQRRKNRNKLMDNNRINYQHGFDNELEESSYEVEINQNTRVNDTNRLKQGNAADKTKQKKEKQCTSQESEINSIETMQETQHESQARKLGHLDERTMVSDDGFGYMVAVLKRSRGFLSAGALIDESWVLTSAEQIQLMRERIRFIRVRLGSVNYKKGGILLPIKDMEIHPYYKSYKPNYDLALLMLAKPVRLTPSIKIIRLQLLPKELTTTHLILSSWGADLVNTQVTKKKPNHIEKPVTRTLKRNPILTVTHLHSSDPEECSEELSDTGNDSAGLMCLETGVKDACYRDSGAPVVVNGVLWAVVSGWMLECDENQPMPVFATVISAANVSSWIHSTVHGHNCLNKKTKFQCKNQAPVVVNGVHWAVVSRWMLECDEDQPMPVFATVISAANVSSWIHSTVHGHNWRVTIN